MRTIRHVGKGTQAQERRTRKCSTPASREAAELSRRLRLAYPVELVQTRLIFATCESAQNNGQVRARIGIRMETNPVCTTPYAHSLRLLPRPLRTAAYLSITRLQSLCKPGWNVGLCMCVCVRVCTLCLSLSLSLALNISFSQSFLSHSLSLLSLPLYPPPSVPSPRSGQVIGTDMPTTAPSLGEESGDRGLT
jgi:hypothetical protein